MTSAAVDTRTGGRPTRYVLFSIIFFRPRVRSAAVRRRRFVPTYLVPTYTFIIIPSHCTPRAYTPLLSRRRVAVACSACRPPLTFSSSATAVGPYTATCAHENLFCRSAVSGCVLCPSLVVFANTEQ